MPADQHGPFFSRRKIEKRDGSTYYERDGWGRLVKKKDDAFFEQDEENILDEKNLLDKLEFESPTAPERYEIAGATSKNLKHRFALVSGVLGLFMGTCRLRGDTRFLMDLADDIPFARSLVFRLMEFTASFCIVTAISTASKPKRVVNLMTGFIETEEVSLYGSPTVSPTTTVSCKGVPSCFRSTSTIFLALSHAPPALAIKIAWKSPKKAIATR